jgi:ferredoxin--NADP+ reductase
MGYRIVEKMQLSEDVFTAKVEAPLVAAAWQPGQFVILCLSDEYGERFPLTVVETDRTKGTIRLIWQRVGKTTAEFAALDEGEELENVVGPLGQPSEIEHYGRVVCVGGGIGNAVLLPITRALKEAGNEIVSILGARTADILILEDEFGAISDEMVVVTDDGSKGRKALVTEPLEEVCRREVKPDKVFAIGPAIMMRFCCQVTRKYDIPTQVSLNTIMVDGTGMCGGCRVEVGGEPRFVCVDGPEFDGHKVDFDLMMKRQAAYKEDEQKAYELYKKHRCKIGLDEGKRA